MSTYVGFVYVFYGKLYRYGQKFSKTYRNSMRTPIVRFCKSSGIMGSGINSPLYFNQTLLELRAGLTRRLPQIVYLLLNSIRCIIFKQILVYLLLILIRFFMIDCRMERRRRKSGLTFFWNFEVANSPMMLSAAISKSFRVRHHRQNVWR